MFEESYHIKLEAFEGPFDLLLQLIEKRKLFINDISLSHVTDDFISFIKQKDNFPLGLSAQFILVASALLFIKSKSLLPTLDLSPEEEASIDDLEARLKEYRHIKELTLHVKALFGQNIVWPKLQTRKSSTVFAPDPSISIKSVLEAALSVIRNMPKNEVKPEVRVRQIVTLEETIVSLTSKIEKALRMSFREFSGYRRGTKQTQEEKVAVIVGFLAMLELAKQGIIAVSQEELFDDISMETETVKVPEYR